MITMSLVVCECRALLASFPGPAQLSIACSTEKWERVRLFIHVWEEPGNEAKSFPPNTGNIRATKVWLFRPNCCTDF